MTILSPQPNLEETFEYADGIAFVHAIPNCVNDAGQETDNVGGSVLCGLVETHFCGRWHN